MSFGTDWYWLDVAKSLTQQGVQITHFISRPPEVQRAASQALVHTQIINQDYLEYPHLIEDQNKNNPVTFSQQLLDSLRKCELEFLAITDRLAFFPLTVKRRKYIYHQLVKFWYHFFLTNKLDGIFLTDTPHVGFDTVLFYLAKQFHIPVISTRRPFIRDRMLLVKDYRQFLPKVPNRFLAGATQKELQNMIGDELMADAFSENFWQKKDAMFNRDIRQPSLMVNLTWSQWFFSLNPRRIFIYLNSLLTMSKYGGFNYNNGQIKLVEKLCGLYHRYHNHQLRRYYGQLAKAIVWPPKNKYIYFPLHLQPERSTTPEGGLFEDQLLALEILNKTVPKTWSIIVKEHPRQFGQFDFQKHTYRNRQYYQQLIALSHVQMAPMSLSQEKLIARATMTATITGTGGWESLKANKPVVVFGNAWYGPCQSCLVVQSEIDCQHALQILPNKTRQEVELDVWRFLAYYRKRLIVASNAREFARQSQRPYQTLVDNMAKAVHQQLRKTR